ncbi:MAG TPA: DUF448 domain-containing protein [Sphingomonadaceae bacterium]|nr:DUF448 domain-containing protein [Sphingomonadaceae bacterium]
MRTPPNEALGPDIAGKGRSRKRANGSEPACPERKCVLTGTTAGRDELLRLAISPEGLVLPDALARAPGRGAWIGVGRSELETAIANGQLRGALSRAFRDGRIEIPPDLCELIENALLRAFLQRLGLELRFGRLLTGSERIAEQARKGLVHWLAHASDASEDGCRKLDQAWRVGMDAEGSGIVGTRLPLDRAALSVALGRDNVVHLALADRASAERVAIPLRRLMRFAGTIPAAANASGDRAADDALPETTTE